MAKNKMIILNKMKNSPPFIWSAKKLINVPNQNFDL